MPEILKDLTNKLLQGGVPLGEQTLMRKGRIHNQLWRFWQWKIRDSSTHPCTLFSWPLLCFTKNKQIRSDIRTCLICSFSSSALLRLLVSQRQSWQRCHQAKRPKHMGVSWGKKCPAASSLSSCQDACHPASQLANQRWKKTWEDYKYTTHNISFVVLSCNYQCVGQFLAIQKVGSECTKTRASINSLST